ncbi:XF1762 family protein [Kitasatospora sp. NPDC085464]|uniref:XF1762 family protein n=1 Tax=Kitasatospora sp. NPDC085464 TaxID=3364063 RepID=UPI0037C7F32E
MSGLAQRRLRIRPLSFAAACAFVADHHRHHAPPQGHKFSLAVVAEPDEQVVGVAIIGRPLARMLDDGLTLEVTRLATDGTANACSALYGAAWRTARAAGYERVVTYTQEAESGTSLRAAGWRLVARRRPRPGWNTPSRPRQRLGTENTGRLMWEITTQRALPLPEAAI